MLTNKLLNNSQIKIMNLDGVDILLSLFAGDTDLFLEPSVECIGAVKAISELDDFGLFSGRKPNLNKTKCIPQGSTQNDAMFLSYHNDTYSSDGEPIMVNSFTALGISFGNYSSNRDISAVGTILKNLKSLLPQEKNSGVRGQTRSCAFERERRLVKGYYMSMKLSLVP